MDLIAAFRTFVRISETGSFSAVAREVGATQPAISRQIAQLEDHLGARLFQRTTRSLAMTADGRDLLVHAVHVLTAVEETEAAVGRRKLSPGGLVRLGCPAAFARLNVAPRLGRLLERHPELRVELCIADDVVDMVQSGLDLAIRVGEVTDASLVARRIGSATIHTMAAASYLDSRGEPADPGALAEHDCLVFTRGAAPDEWDFMGDGGVIAVPVRGRLRTDGIEALAAAAVAGLGISRLPLWLVRDELADGRMRRILRPWRVSPRPIFAIYPSRRFLAARTRVLIDFLVDEFRLDAAVSPYGQPPEDAS